MIPSRSIVSAVVFAAALAAAPVQAAQSGAAGHWSGAI